MKNAGSGLDSEFAAFGITLQPPANYVVIRKKRLFQMISGSVPFILTRLWEEQAISGLGVRISLSRWEVIC